MNVAVRPSSRLPKSLGTRLNAREMSPRSERVQKIKPIFEFARRHGAVLVTINRADFADLAGLGRDHPGVIILPSVVGQELATLFRAPRRGHSPVL